MYDVIIIGGGSAGLTAAIYSSRALLKTLVLQGPQPGGQLTTTTEIENFPGFPEGIMGPELMENMKKQAERFGTEIKTDTILNIKPSFAKTSAGKQIANKTFIIEGENEVYEAKAVIIAVGAQAKMLGIPSEEMYRGKGISYCATCDGFFFRGKNIAVLGGGDTAMEEATFLTRFVSSVMIIHRREGFRASPIMLERAKANPKIKFLLNTIVEEFYGEGVLQGITSKDVITGKTEKLPFDGVFVAIGYTPATEFLKEIIELDEKGYIKTIFNLQFSRLHLPSTRADGGQAIFNKISNAKDQKQNVENTIFQTMTSVEGIFAAGDCVDAKYRQGIVAAGMGAMAALDVEKYLQGLE